MIKKQYLKSRPVCKVTFSLSPDKGADKADVVGDFTDWQPSPMEQLKNGSFKVVLELPQGNEYQFRYLLNGSEWINETEADHFVPNPYSGENSVVTI
ncbi:MAG: isoamylase early set domain-containing protein [Anaerolineae bacterium]|nr:isoamylase early set domain-containing protein [Anaerolineae bacterium]